VAKAPTPEVVRISPRMDGFRLRTRHRRASRPIRIIESPRVDDCPRRPRLVAATVIASASVGAGCWPGDAPTGDSRPVDTTTTASDLHASGAAAWAEWLHASRQARMEILSRLEGLPTVWHNTAFRTSSGEESPFRLGVMARGGRISVEYDQSPLMGSGREPIMVQFRSGPDLGQSVTVEFPPDGPPGVWAWETDKRHFGPTIGEKSESGSRRQFVIDASCLPPVSSASGLISLELLPVITVRIWAGSFDHNQWELAPVTVYWVPGVESPGDWRPPWRRLPTELATSRSDFDGPIAYEVQWPVGGEWLVSQGALSPPTHTGLWAVDLCKVDAWRRISASRAGSMTNDQHYCFGETVRSPINAVVWREFAEGEDLPPTDMPEGGSPNNFIILADQRDLDFGMFFGHLKRHAVAVKAGQRISTGDPIAQVGNSGESQGPHLHMEARFRNQSCPVVLPDMETRLNPDPGDPWRLRWTMWHPQYGTLARAAE
jgi:hypothetical protein